MFLKSGKKQPKGKFLTNSDYENEANILNSIEFLFSKCNGRILKRNYSRSSHKPRQPEENISLNYLKLIYNEFFYSHVDRPWFKQNEFRDFLQRLNIDIVTKLMVFRAF